MLDTVNPQPAPQPGGQDVTALVIADLEARAKGGEAKYGTRLQTHNGRDPLIDSYQESMDITCYLRQAIAEIADLKAERDAALARERRLREALSEIKPLADGLAVGKLYPYNIDVLGTTWLYDLVHTALAEGGPHAP